MVDLHSILASHHSNKKIEKSGPLESNPTPVATTSEIPDLFFDRILVEYKLNRIETMTLMFLYRSVWCRPNLHRKYGISQILSHSDMASGLNVSIEEIYQAIRKLEALGFIDTIRAGQYFVRKYFTKENDAHYGQVYDDF